VRAAWKGQAPTPACEALPGAPRQIRQVSACRKWASGRRLAAWGGGLLAACSTCIALGLGPVAQCGVSGFPQVRHGAPPCSRDSGWRSCPLIAPRYPLCQLPLWLSVAHVHSAQTYLRSDEI
jgi:hypothetical protein